MDLQEPGEAGRLACQSVSSLLTRRSILCFVFWDLTTEGSRSPKEESTLYTSYLDLVRGGD